MKLKNLNLILLILFILGKNSVEAKCTIKQLTTTTSKPIDITQMPIINTTTLKQEQSTAAPIPVTTTQSTAAPISVTTTQSTAAPIPVTTTQSTAASIPVTTTQSTAASIPVATTQSTAASISVTTTQSTAAPILVTTTQSTAAPISVTTTQSTAAPTPVTTTASTTRSTATPSIITTSFYPIKPIDLCVHYMGTKYNLIASKAVFVSTQVVATVKNDPVPCCQVCNQNPKCSMYTYAINGRDQSKSVCKLYSLSDNLSYNFMYLDYLSRVITDTVVGFPYSYIHFF